MKRIAIILTGITVIALVAVFSCKTDAEEQTPEVREIIEAVYSSGYVMPRNDYQVYALGEGFLIKKLAEAGTEVTRDQPLFIIGSDQQNARLSNTQQIYNMAKLNYSEGSPILQEAKVAMNNSYAKMKNDSVTLVRYRNLLANKATSQMEFDRIELQYESSRNEFLAQKQRYEKLKNQLYIELKNAENNFKIAEVDKDNYTITSNVNGMVYQTFKEEGEMVRRGEPLATVGSKDQVYLQLQVDEMDVNKVKLGQEIVVKVDVYGDRTFRAKVTKIYPMINRAEQSFRVDAEFLEMLPSNFAGLSVEANIIIQEKEKALTIPKIYLVDSNFVWVEKNGDEEKVKITKGIETMEYVEVLSGLDKDSKIILK